MHDKACPDTPDSAVRPVSQASAAMGSLSVPAEVHRLAPVDCQDPCSSSVTVTVSGQPDLVVGTPSEQQSGRGRGSLHIVGYRPYRGEAATASTTPRCYRSVDATISTGDTLAGTDAVIALGANGSSGESITLTAPSDAGMYYYGACVDAVAGESDTTNNCSTGLEVQVTTPGPDLVVDGASVDSDKPDISTTFTLSATVRNQGADLAAATTLRYYRLYR